MKLKNLKLTNFKGIKEFTLNADGKNISIFGDNAQGKTTLFDAYNWILFGKDSLDRKNFGIKPYDADGEEIHNLESIVESEFISPNMALKRVYVEKYIKKKGDLVAEFKGNTTTYYVNELEVKEDEFKVTVSKIIDEEIFKILSNPLYFSSVMKWENRRNILFSMCYSVTDADIISKTHSLTVLSGALEKHQSIFNYENFVDSKMKSINKEMTDIPSRINELQKTVVDIDKNITEEQLKNSLTVIEQKKNIKLEELSKLKNNDTSALDAELNTAIKKLNDYERKFNAQQAELKMVEHKKAMEESKIRQCKINELSRLEEKIISLNKLIAEGLAKKLNFIEMWRFETAKEFSFPDTDQNCDKCGQSLPIEKVEELRSTKLAEFNLQKSKNIEEIIAKGHSAKKEREKYELSLQLSQKRVAELEKEINDSNNRDITVQESKDEKLEEQAEYKTLLQTRIAIEQNIKIVKEQSDNTGAISELQEIIKEFDLQLQEIATKIATNQAVEKTVKRIEELIIEEKTLAGEYQRWQKAKYLCEEFTKAKINTVEGIINNKFKLTKFKLFDVQVNGSIKEICEATFLGVPYSDLNHAQTINTGLDIISTLSGHYGVDIPVWVDNAESVTKINKPNSQLIQLVVSEKDKTLRIEVEQ